MLPENTIHHRYGQRRGRDPRTGPASGRALSVNTFPVSFLRNSPIPFSPLTLTRHPCRYGTVFLVAPLSEELLCGGVCTVTGEYRVWVCRLRRNVQKQNIAGTNVSARTARTHAPLAGELLCGGVVVEQLLPEHAVYDRGRESCPLAAPRLVLRRRSFGVSGDLGQGRIRVRARVTVRVLDAHGQKTFHSVFIY